MDEGLGGFIFGAIIGIVVTSYMWAVMITGTINDTALRALSCMANGNTIAQCETVLGVKAGK